MRKLLLIYLIINVNGLFGQNSVIIGGRQNGMAGAGSLIADVWSVKNNPGAFGFFEGLEVGLQYQDRFLLSELASKNLGFGQELKSGNFGIYLQQTGFELFKQIQAGGGYSLKLSKRMAMGVNINYHLLQLGDIYGSKHNVSAGLGIAYFVKDDLMLGASIININRAKLFNQPDERLPTYFIFGLKYQLSAKTLILIDLEKELALPLNLKTGVEVKANEMFNLRLGVNTYPFRTAFGTGIKIKKLTIDLAAVWHAQIGLSPTLGMVYQFK